MFVSQEHCLSYFKRVFCLLATSYMTRRASESETLSPEAFSRRFREKLQSSRNGKKRKKLKAETWIKLGIKAEEIKQTPNDVLAQLNQANGNLPATLEKFQESYNSLEVDDNVSPFYE